MNKKYSKPGQISKVLIIIAVIVFLLIVIVFSITRLVISKKPQTSNTQNNAPPAGPPPPTYETVLGDTRFLLLSSEDLGNVLKSNLSYQSDIVTTEKFIRVVIGAQNKGKTNIDQYSWDVGDIIDSDGRHFVSINDKAFYLLPRPDLCGALLKPEFTPSLCVKYFEVSKVSKGLKVTVKISKPKKKEALLDLNLIYRPPSRTSPPPPQSQISPPPPPLSSSLCNNNGVCEVGEKCVFCSPTFPNKCSGCADCGVCSNVPGQNQ